MTHYEKNERFVHDRVIQIDYNRKIKYLSTKFESTHVNGELSALKICFVNDIYQTKGIY